MTKEIQLKVKDTYRVIKTEKATKNGMDGEIPSKR